MSWGNCSGECSENTPVARYEMGLQQQLAEKDSAIALRDANTYNERKTLKMYKYVDGGFRKFEATLAQQAIVNQKTSDNIELVCKNMAMDTERRCCADNAKIFLFVDRCSKYAKI